MVQGIVIAALALVTLSLALPTWRRIWVFHLFATKHLLRFIAGKLGLRRLAATVTGNQGYEPLTFARTLRLFCEDMGPTFIKFGQIIASSAGLFPDEWVVEFQYCLDRVRPFPFEMVRQRVASDLGEEKASDLEDIEQTPLASASIAQVHNARLKDGTSVVVKVQRPGLEARVSADMRIIRTIARVIAAISSDARMANPVGVVDDFSRTLSEELDFRKEASNLDRFNEIMADLGHSDIRAPVPHWALTTHGVLVMERFHGIRVDDVEAIRDRGLDGEGNLVKGLRAWFQTLIFYGFFHGDVHAGNLMLLDDGDIGFIDFGIVGRFDDRTRHLVTDWIVAFSMADFKTLAKTIVDMGGAPPSLDMDSFTDGLASVYGPLLEKNFGEVDFAEVVPEMRRVARAHSMTLPQEFVLLTKQLLYFDRYAKLLAPELNIFRDPRIIVGMMEDIQRARQEERGSA